MPLLEITNLDVNYGDFQAVKDITMNIEEGSIVSLIGANGAGKSTIMNAICGINKPKSGKIVFNGHDITGQKPHTIARLGLTMSPEGSHCFEKMTVQDNLLMGAYMAKSNAERMEKLENVYKLFPVLREKGNQLSTFLSGGQRQMLAIGRAIMSDPKILLCDEISLGLAPVIIKDIYVKLNEIAAQGITMLIVEQDVTRSLKNSDYSYVILEGRIVMQGASKELDINEVNDAFFGLKAYSHTA